MKRFMNSIKVRLFASIFAFISLFLITVGLFIHQEVREIVFDTIDRTLHSKEQVISGLLHEEKNAIELELEEVVTGEYSMPRSGHYFKVMMDGSLLAASPSLVDSGFDLTAGVSVIHGDEPRESVFTSIGPGGEPVRVLQHEFGAFGKSFIIYVAESLGDSLDMIRRFTRFLLIVIPSGIVVVSFIVIWIAGRSLNPLVVFSGRIRRITHKTLGERIDAGAETRELADLAGSFNNMLDRLQKVFESEKRLIADASHELKTPLSVIRLQCDVVLQQERAPEEYIDAVKTIRSVSDSIDALVKDLLSQARLDSGILSSREFGDISLNDCIKKSAAMVQPFVVQRSIRVVTILGDDIIIAGNAENLTEAFFNILENGVKYNRDNGTVEVFTGGNDVEAVVSVRDTGPGIGKDDAARIFDRFYRAGSVRNADGTGLGLSIASAIIEAHGGRIMLESEPGQGSTFHVILPCKRHSMDSTL